MGIEHSIKDEPEQTRRCPCCKHVSTVSTQDGRDFYFYCQNPACNVERIYGDNAVMVSGHQMIRHDDKPKDKLHEYFFARSEWADLIEKHEQEKKDK